MKRRILAIAGALAVTASLGAFVPAEAKDPCFFTQDEFNTWKNEKNGQPGWGDGLGHVEAIANCVGTWVFKGSNTYYWRVWAQPDGDKVWINFKDRYLDPNLTPRFIAKIEAGVTNSNDVWEQHFYEG